MIKNSLSKSYAIAVDFPSGAILPFGGTISPAGWLLCNGDSLLISQYPSLFAAIGKAWGSADSTHFNIPDLRGRFLRGVDGGIARDPDRASRTNDKTGGNSGDNVGSVQAEATKKNGLSASAASSAISGTIGGADGTHTHTSTASSVTGTVGSTPDGSHSHTSNSSSVTGSIGSDGAHEHTYVKINGDTFHANLANVFQGGSNQSGISAQYTPIADTLNARSTGSAHSHTHSLTAGAQTINSTNSSHSHTSMSLTAAAQTINSTNSAHGHTHSLTAAAQSITIGTGDNETRPVNANVNYIIKI